jgi:hypothetical protein
MPAFDTQPENPIGKGMRSTMLLHRRAELKDSTMLRPPGLALRLHVFLRRRRLDRALAEGSVACQAEHRELREAQLEDPARRRRLAHSLRRTVADAENPTVAMQRSSVPLPREIVLPLREGLLGLAERLEQPGPVNPCGVARLRLLLSDRRGPLYNRRAERSLSDAIWWIADGLQLCPPHPWGSPVRTTVDPDLICWTCAGCGALATTRHAAVKPA